MADLREHRLGGVEAWCPHVAVAIAGQQLVLLLTLVVEDRPLVVELDLLAGLDVVVYHHLVLAPDEGAADLDRRQPADMEVAIRLSGYIRVTYAMFSGWPGTWLMPWAETACGRCGSTASRIERSWTRGPRGR
jgi:hypothetical protein